MARAHEEPDITMNQNNEPTPQKPLRLWPGVVAVALQWLIMFVAPIVMTPEIEGPARRYRATGAFNLGFFLNAIPTAETRTGIGQPQFPPRQTQSGIPTLSTAPAKASG